MLSTAFDRLGRMWAGRRIGATVLKGCLFCYIQCPLRLCMSKGVGKCEGYALRSPDDVVLPPYYPEDSIVRRDIAVMYSNIYRMDCCLPDD